MRNFPAVVQRLIQRSKTTHRLPKIHYWKRLVKEMQNQHDHNYWQCFTFYSRKDEATSKPHVKNNKSLNQRIYLGHLHPDIYLTSREIEVALLLMQGLTCKHIARQLSIVDRTVESYVKKLKLKFNCQFKIELVDIFKNIPRIHDAKVHHN